MSGNPRGRPPGSGLIAKLRADIAANLPQVIEKLIEMAKAGDTAAARLLMERSLAPLRAAEQAEAMHLPDGTLAEIGRAIITGMGDGTLAPGQAQAAMNTLRDLAAVVESTELEQRLASVEARIAAQGERP